MKKILFLIVAIVSFAACQKIKDLANIPFDIPYSQNITIPAIPGYTYGMPLPGGGVDLPFPPIAVAINAQQYFDQYHASPRNLVSADLGNANLEITAPGYQYFDFLDTIQLFISTESQPEILVAYDYNIPKGKKIISLFIVPGLNLKNYVTGDSLTIRLDTHINAIPAPGTQVHVSGNFHIVANPL